MGGQSFEHAYSQYSHSKSKTCSHNRGMGGQSVTRRCWNQKRGGVDGYLRAETRFPTVHCQSRCIPILLFNETPDEPKIIYSSLSQKSQVPRHAQQLHDDVSNSSVQSRALPHSSRVRQSPSCMRTHFTWRRGCKIRSNSTTGSR